MARPASAGFLYLDELARPQAKYFLYYPLAVALAALMLWIYPTDMMTAVSSFIATVISCLMMWEYLFTNKAIRFSSVCSMGLLIGYGAGTLNSWLTISRAGYPLAAIIGQTVPEMANGVAAALMGCALMLCIGELVERPILTMSHPIVITGGMKRLVFVNSVLLAVAFAAGKFVQGGVKSASAHKAGMLSIFLVFLVGPTVILATIVFLVERVKKEKLLFGAIILFLWLLEVTQGRRNLVYPALVTIGLARYAGYRWGRISWGKVVLVAAAAVFLFLGVLSYQLLRLAGYAASSHSIGAETRQAERWATEGRAWQIATTSSIQNVKQRTLIIPFLSDLLYRTKTEKPAEGKDLLLQTEVTIPSVIYRNKPTIVEETLASETFGIQYPDLANSLFTAGALDFGIWGVMIYPVVTILLFSLFLRVGMTYLSNEVFFFGLALFVETAMAAEQQLNGYLGAMRDLLAFAIFLYVVSKLPLVKWKPVGR